MPITVYGKISPEHKRFNVAKNATLWRYMDIGKFLDVMTKKKIWFTRVSEFRKSDPYESALTQYDEIKTKLILEAKTRDELKKILRQYNEDAIADIIDLAPDKSFELFKLVYLTKLPPVNISAYTHSVSCWHKNITESDAMWEIYAKRDAGIAIKSTTDRLLNAFSASERTMYIAKVIYDSTRKLSVLTPGMLDPLLIKRHAFRHENEIRVIASTMDGYESPDWTEDKKNYIINTSKTVAGGFYIDCDINGLIEEIVVSPLMPPYSSQAIEKIMESIAPNIPVRKSKLITKEEIDWKLSTDLHRMLDHYKKTGFVLDINDLPPA